MLVISHGYNYIFEVNLSAEWILVWRSVIFFLIQIREEENEVVVIIFF